MLSARPASIRGAAITVAHGLVGWALCGATMAIGMKATTLGVALIIHAVAAPLVFMAVAFAYFRRMDSWPPFRTTTVFVGVVFAMDVLVVAFAVQRSFAMFGSILGTWLPFLLIFLSTWWTGLAVHRASRRRPA